MTPTIQKRRVHCYRRLQNIDGQSVVISDKLYIIVVINKAVKMTHIMLLITYSFGVKMGRRKGLDPV